MRQTPYSFLTDEEFIALMETRATTELEVEAKQRLQVHVEHPRNPPRTKYHGPEDGYPV